MAKKNRQNLKDRYLNGMKPNQEDFAHLIDSSLNQLKDDIHGDGDGNIGIGTDAPAEKLHVFDAATGSTVSGVLGLVTGNKESAFKIQTKNNTEGISRLSLRQQNDVGGDISYDGTGGVENLRLTVFGNGTSDKNVVISNNESAGNRGYMGIGTDSPEEQLHVKGDDATIKIQNNDSQGSPKLSIKDSTDSGVELAYKSTGFSDYFQLNMKHPDGDIPSIQIVNRVENRRGWVGILCDPNLGVAAPLHINKANDVTDDGSPLEFENGSLLIGNPYDDGTTNMAIDTNEIMVRKGTQQTSNLYLQKDGGTVYIHSNVVVTSDKLAKKNITPLKCGLKEVLDLKPVSYFKKNDPERKEKSLGFIAQDVQKVIKEVVHDEDTKHNLLGIDYNAMIPVLTKAIQDQNAMILKLEKKVAALEKKMK